MDLRERLKKFHEEQGVSYKAIALSIGVSIGVMYNYTSGIRDLKPKVSQNLDQFLKDRDY